VTVFPASSIRPKTWAECLSKPVHYNVVAEVAISAAWEQPLVLADG
jgi:hypothetical protein